jgi:phage terminase large subunit-like protein
VPSQESLGAWLVKASGGDPSTKSHVAHGFADVVTRCVRRSYRTDLIEEGQRVLLWVSGSERDLPAGIYAHGHTTGPAAAGVMPVTLTPVRGPVLRSELVSHPDLAALEVIRMPAGSNPSYVTPAQLSALQELCPEFW